MHVHVRTWHEDSACALYIVCVHIYSARELRKSRERVELERRYLSVATSKVFAGYTRESIYIPTDCQVLEGLCRGPEFSHNYTIGYIIIT